MSPPYQNIMKNNNEINIYWTPHSFPYSEVGDWNMLYEDPITLMDYWKDHLIKEEDEPSFISCPGFKNLAKNTYVFNNLLDSKYEFETFSRDQNQILVTPTSKSYLASSVVRNQTMDMGPSISFSMRYLFFAEESVKATLTPPYMHETEYMRSGVLTSGEYDIGQWFRPINVEIQMFNNKGNIHIKEEQPLFYIRFLTDKKINLKRFVLTPTLDSYSKKCVDAKSYFGARKPLDYLYEKFTKSRTRDLVLREIKENLL